MASVAERERLMQRLISSAWPMGLLFLVLTGSLYGLGAMALQLDRFGRYYHALLAINGLALLFITALIATSTWRLVREFRARVAGSRLTVKLIAGGVLLALIPVLLVYGFSIHFLRANINSYFDIAIEQALDDALELSRESLGLQMRTLRRDTVNVAQQLVDVDERVAVIVLNALSGETEASEMTLIGADNRIIASTGLLGNMAMQPDRPDDDLADHVRLGNTYVAVDPIGDSDLYIRVVTPVFSDDPGRDNAILQALYPVASRSAGLAESVQSSYQQYRQLVFLREPLIVSSMLTLSLVMLLSVAMAIWLAFQAARRLMVPVHDLVAGTRAVAEGDYGTRIYLHSRNDELGFLVQSFNHMTLQLEQARQSADESQRAVERERAFLEATLAQISSGVVTLDAERVVRTCNRAAVDIIGQPLSDRIGQTLGSSPQDQSVYGQLAERLEAQLDRAPSGHWTLEIDVMDSQGRRFLFCRGTTFDSGTGTAPADAVTVIAIDDMTRLIGAQRDAAWSEVARRLAHEIKNPLTPIRLSAERLRLKCLPRLAGRDAELLERLTHTIENQVDAMKSMVNAFADYATAPKLSLVPIDVNVLVAEVAELYRREDDHRLVRLSLDAGLGAIAVDPPRLRQMLHNLIKNALEAQRDSDRPMVEISTRECRGGDGHRLEIETRDAGPGIPVELLGRVFEPYVSAKPKGTGLGLAVVKKIVEEHEGHIVAENLPEGGAVVRIVLPYPKRAGYGEHAA